MLNSESMGWPLRAGWMLLIGTQFLPVWFSSYAVVILCLLIGWNWKSLNGRVLRTDTWFFLLLAYFCWQLISLFWTSNSTDAAANLSTQFLLLLIPALLFVKKPNRDDVHWLLKAQFFASLLAVIYALAYGIWRVYQSPIIDEVIYNAYLFYTGLSEPIMHPGYFSLQLIVSLGILAGFVHRKHWKLNFWTLAIGLLLLTTLFMLNGRMTMLSALLTLAMALVYQAVSKKHWLPMLVLAGLTLVLSLGYFLLPKPIQDRLLELTESFDYDIATFDATDYNGVTIRLAQWECAAEVIKDNFWLGTGAGDGKDELRAVYTKRGFQAGLEGQYNSHNQFVEAVLYGGIIQAFLLLCIFVYGLWKGLTNHNPAFVAFLAFVFLCMQTETVLFWHRGVLFFSLFASILYLQDAQKHQSKSNN